MKKKFTYCWRLSPITWEEDAAFAQVVRIFEKEPTAADTIAFFIAEPSSFGYYPIDKLEKQLAIYEKRAAVFRAMGKSVGINVWPTFGQGGAREEEAPAFPSDFDGMVGYDGTVDCAIPCPTSPGFLANVTERYRLMAKTKPDFIWVDDDTRFTHLGGVPFPCFCDRCLAGFDGGKWTRETLVAALNDPKEKALRLAWCHYEGQRLADFCTALRRAVDEVDPSIELPFMSVGLTHTTYAGDYLPLCLEALRSKMLRPGHGFYHDDRPAGMFWKAMEVGRQVRQCPEGVEEILWEEESHPCEFLSKSTSARLKETLLMLTMGGTGIAFNHLGGSGSPGSLAMLEYEGEMRRLAAAKPVYEAYLDFAADLPMPTGVYPLDSIYMMAHMDCTDGWFWEGGYGPYSIDTAESIGRFGVPLTPFPTTASVTVLTGRTMDSRTDAELTEIFSRGVIMDRDALVRLEERGLAQLAGVRLSRRRCSSIEVCTDHPMNGPFAGYNRIALDMVYELESLPGCDVEALSVAKCMYGGTYGTCVSKFENGLGGKVVVFAYGAWADLGHPCKVWQISEIIRWMGVPASIRFAKPYAIGSIAPFVRTDGKKAAVLLVNAFMDPSPAFELLLKGEMTSATLMSTDGRGVTAEVHREGDTLAVSVPTMAPWGEWVVLAQ